MMNTLRSFFTLGVILATIMVAAPCAHAAFGVTSSGGYYTVDSGAGLVFDVAQASGDITRIVYNGNIALALKKEDR